MLLSIFSPIFLTYIELIRYNFCHFKTSAFKDINGWPVLHIICNITHDINQINLKNEMFRKIFKATSDRL